MSSDKPAPTTANTTRGARSIKRILDAAARLFGQEGFQGASMNSVAAAAGVSKGLLHYHFRSKEHLLLEAQRATFRQIHARFTERTRAGAGGMPTALEALDAMWQALRDMRGWTPFMVETLSLAQNEGPLRQDMDDFYQEAYDLLVAGIEDVLADDLGNLTVPQQRMARLIRLAMNGLIIELSLARTEEDLAEIDQIYQDIRLVGERLTLRQLREG